MVSELRSVPGISCEAAARRPSRKSPQQPCTMLAAMKGSLPWFPLAAIERICSPETSWLVTQLHFEHDRYCVTIVPPAISDIPSLVAPSVGGSASWILLKSSAGNVAKAALTSSTLAPLTTAARPEELR
eukprot:gnl/TRDRNA2_/TRDRNA2_177267_c6_seq1.p1 gnl/TRDRNA2_/TRDRNA2_177267_c6~~gnl/TRDRNA2_/TRDRNA2_177267_c6_seq1.p1  ORF type:complete len:129 (+),score=15.46 gnl/TRDRNA2_/TRDRNA2_177267_c6_seq1:547-933(+)